MNNNTVLKKKKPYSTGWGKKCYCQETTDPGESFLALQLMKITYYPGKFLLASYQNVALQFIVVMAGSLWPPVRRLGWGFKHHTSTNPLIPSYKLGRCTCQTTFYCRLAPMNVSKFHWCHFRNLEDPRLLPQDHGL